MTPSNPLNPGISIEQRVNPSVARADAIIDKIAQSLRVALPGIVQSFDPGPPATVSVLVATDEWVTAGQQFWQTQPGFTGPAPNPNILSIKSGPVTLPLLQDVPVVTLGGGGWTLTFPIQVGDECLVIFTDTPLDVWLQNGGTGNAPISQRRHSLSDAVAIVGWRSTPRGLANYSTTSAQLRNNDGSVVIDLTTDQATITAPKVVVNTTGDTDITAGGDVNVQSSGKTSVQAAGDVDIKSTGGNVNVTSDTGDVSVACATGTASISAKNISLSGTTQLDLEGALVKIALRTFLLHTHTGGTILGLTGPVV
jgi:hypothetical protein